MLDVTSMMRMIITLMKWLESAKDSPMNKRRSSSPKGSLHRRDLPKIKRESG